VQKLNANELGIQASLEVVQMVLRDDSVQLVLAASSHHNRTAAIVDLAVGRDEVVQLVLLLRVECNAKDIGCKNSTGKQTEESGDLHGGQR
jgi:hypothetical protein